MNAGSPSMCVHPAWALIRAERASQLPIHPSVASVEGSFLVLRTLLAVESTAGGSCPCCPSGYTSGTSEIPATTGRHGSCDFVLLSTPGQLEISFSPPSSLEFAYHQGSDSQSNSFSLSIFFISWFLVIIGSIPLATLPSFALHTVEGIPFAHTSHSFDDSGPRTLSTIVSPDSRWNLHFFIQMSCSCWLSILSTISRPFQPSDALAST